MKFLDFPLIAGHPVKSASRDFGNVHKQVISNEVRITGPVTEEVRKPSERRKKGKRLAIRNENKSK